MIFDSVIFKVLLVIAGVLAAICFFMVTGRFVAGKKLPFSFVILALICVLLGADKSPIAGVIFYRTDPEIVWLKDNGSYVSNDVIHVAWSPHAQLPWDATLQMWHCPTNNAADPNAWVQYGGDVAVVDCPFEFDIIYTNALEYAWLFMTTYVRTPISITNNTYNINCIKRETSANTIGIPIHTEIKINDKTINNFTTTQNQAKE